MVQRARLDVVLVGVEDLAEVAFERVGPKGVAKRPLPRADLARKEGEGSLAPRRRGEAPERLVNVGLRGVVDGDRLLGEQGGDELRGPDALLGSIDVGERLKGDRGVLVARLVAGAPDGERRGARAPVLVEEDDLRARILQPPERQHAEQRRLAGARRPDDERVADVPDGEVQAKRRRARRAAIKVRVADAAHALEVAVDRVAGPHRREGHQVREVERMNERPANVRVDVARQAPEPRVGRVEGLVAYGEAARLDDLFNALALSPRLLEREVPHGDGRRQVPERHEVVAELLQGRVGVCRAVRGGVVDEGGLLFARLLLDQGPEALAFGPPLLSVFLNQRFGSLLVEAEVTRHPAVFGVEVVERVENARHGRRRKPRHGHRADEVVAQHGDVAGRKRHVGQKRIEIHQRLGRTHGVAMRRDRAVQVRERLVVVEHAHLGKDAGEDVGDFGDRLLKGRELPREHRALVGGAGSRVAHVKERRGARAALRGEFPGEGEVVARLVVASGLFEGSLALLVDDGGCGMRPCRARVGARFEALRFDEEAPARAQAAKGVIDAGARRDELGAE